jgi:hypothetical protein
MVFMPKKRRKEQRVNKFARTVGLQSQLDELVDLAAQMGQDGGEEGPESHRETRVVEGSLVREVATMRYRVTRSRVSPPKR